MQYDLDDVKTTIRDHPAETIAVVSVLGLIGTLFYCHRQKKRYQIELAQLQAARPFWRSKFVRQRRQPEYVLEFVA